MPQAKTRSPFGVWILSIITCGIYGMVWMYKVTEEVRSINPQNPENRTGANVILSLFFGVFTLYIWPIINWFKFCGSVKAEQQAVGLQPMFSTGLATFLALIGFSSIYVQSQQNQVVIAIQQRMQQPQQQFQGGGYQQQPGY
ncbi:DUF4234 domain-containing protein [Glycomyces buryatensis]|uniref:DUF4234 domain-containing protein n=1 Tax=Glycomyces buryatensis TaxID=2570927 RepID=A0A4S8PQW9_9ACTN|nr:DUF4234 domain-containing protein [Glycomyces buryatensis]THV33538.1 DUF4234 domain-containing protein [Glycomyces buryatensis]